MTTQQFGLTPQGFRAMRLADIKQFNENALIAEFGQCNLDPQAVFGQFVGVNSKSQADIWENLEDVYLSQYPNSASGIALDNVVGLNGITRLPQTRTSVIATCAGNEGTSIPMNSIAQIASTAQNFFANVGGIITAQNANIINVTVGTITTQAYTMIVSNQVFSYSKPIITFTNVPNIFVASNVITVTLNGVQLTPVNFITDSDTTLAAVATEIATFSGVASATPTNPDVITIIPVVGSNIVVNTIQITGGASQATWAITFEAPANADAVTANLTASLNTVAIPPNTFTAVDNMDGTLTINSNTPSDPFSCIVGTNLSITYRASPINFLAENFGPVACPVNSLTTIITPISGWSSITNLAAGVTGTLQETDAQLRTRRKNSLKLLGLATVEAIEAHLMQDVPGVTSATVYENRTLTQEDIVIIFPAPFDMGDTITFSYNTFDSFPVAFNVDQAQTMTDLVAAIELIPSVSSATFGGVGNQTVTIEMLIVEELTVDSVTTDVSAQTATINGGRPPKSFEAVVEGGSDDAVANSIWTSKPAGIETFGNVNNGNGIQITDSQGNIQVIFFSRPTPIYIWVTVALTLYAEETFPLNGAQLVKEAIFNYGESLGVGIDVLFQRVLAQIFSVQGIASGNMQIAFTTLPGDSPSYSTADITIAQNQISIFDLDRIVVTVV